MNKRLSLLFLSFSFCLFGCNNVNDSSNIIDSSSNSSNILESNDEISNCLSPSSEDTPIDFLDALTVDEKTNLSLQGYAKEGIKDFSKYVGTSAYKEVSNADEFINALLDAKYEYDNVWDDQTNTYTQSLTKEGTVHVIELTDDINLGYYTLSEQAKSKTQIVSDYGSKYNSYKDSLYFSSMFLENGISQIKIEKTSNLMIFSKNGAKITHAGFKLTSCDNIVIRNIEFDELWQWEDAINEDVGNIGDYDYFGWTYFKIAFCGYVWIDHCKFGKSYDGQIDYSNANYHSTKSTSFRAPYGATGEKGLSITWCDFAAGSADKDGYLYKMMNELEQAYLNKTCTALYYKVLREEGVPFEDILGGLARPQKKGFLIGDDHDYKADNHVEYDYNLELFVTFANCRFINLEDRLPKVRGGNVYLNNCIVDATEYNGYRTNLKVLSAPSHVRSVNGTWKCALVSQGIVCGQGGSVRADNCMFLGIQTLLKNNDSGSSSPYHIGGYQLNNCKYEYETLGYTGSSSDPKAFFKNANRTTLTTDAFKWNTIDGSEPYIVEVLIPLESLNEVLTNKLYGVGINNNMHDYLLTFIYM